MFFLLNPAEREVRHFLAAQEASQLSYPDVGKSRVGTSPGGYGTDHNRIQLGTGIETFERAKSAIQRWKMFEMPWLQLCWPDVPIMLGTNVAILIFASRVLVAQCGTDCLSRRRSRSLRKIWIRLWNVAGPRSAG